jgi:HPt (histidine-containing phosphotransfer) domain-containing protein
MESNCRYDLTGFSNDLGLPIEDIADLFSDLIKEINSEIFKIKIFLNEKDLEELKRINHNIKGISANYRIHDIHEETLKISNALKNGNVKDIEALINDFFVISENAVSEIASYFKQKGFIIT